VVDVDEDGVDNGIVPVAIREENMLESF